MIIGLYDVLLRAEPSPVVELNRAIAVAMRARPEAGLLLMDDLLGRGELADYQLAHSARAELCRSLGRTAGAIGSYERALELTRQEPQLAYSARAELCRTLGRTAEAITSYERALQLTRQEPQRRFIEWRLNELEKISVRKGSPS